MGLDVRGRPLAVRRPAAGLVRRPEARDDVVPFLENVTRGRGIPRERLEEVGSTTSTSAAEVADQRPEPRVPRRAARGLRRQRARPAGLLGQPQLGPLPHRHAGQMADDGVRRAPASSPRPTRRTPAAGSTARTSPTPSRRRGRAAARPAAALLQPPGFVEPMVDATLAALAELPTPRDSAHLVFVTHSIPEAMNDASGPDGGAYVASTAASPRRSSSGCASRPATAPPRAGLLLALRRRRTSRGSSPTSTTTSSWLAPTGEPRRSCWCRSASSPTTWRSSTTSTPRRCDRREARAAVRAGRHGRHRPALRRDGPRPAARARRGRARRADGGPGAPSRAACRPAGTAARPAAAPTRAARRPALCGAGRGPRRGAAGAGGRGRRREAGSAGPRARRGVVRSRPPSPAPSTSSPRPTAPARR
jgi:hypothetical protein